MVIITDGDSSIEFSNSTSRSGYFSIEGDFSGDSEIQFQDVDDLNKVLAKRLLTIFPGAELDIRDISIENGTVEFEDILIDFTGDVIENNCVDGGVSSGSIKLRIEDSDGDIELIVQIFSSASITNGSEVNCDNILIGQELKVRGKLLVGGNSVDATLIDVQ